jgi:hypothetical protein
MINLIHVCGKPLLTQLFMYATDPHPTQEMTSFFWYFTPLSDIVTGSPFSHLADNGLVGVVLGDKTPAAQSPD